ncbi:MAG: 2'-5' RNA ligase family protein, partial [Promethearchaeota archaeon]
MIRSFIAIELKDKKTIENITYYSSRLKQNQQKIKLVKPENLHLTVKFLGNISEPVAPKIYTIIQNNINND